MLYIHIYIAGILCSVFFLYFAFDFTDAMQWKIWTKEHGKFRKALKTALFANFAEVETIYKILTVRGRRAARLVNDLYCTVQQHEVI